MSQVVSGYERKALDTYITPTWVTEALLPHIAWQNGVWEPAAGPGNMLEVLRKGATMIVASDIHGGWLWPSWVTKISPEAVDFLEWSIAPRGVTAIVTNPPFKLATAFCEHALRLMEPRDGIVAMLLRVDFDSAKTRSHLFRCCPAWSKKIVLTKRIVWFEPEGDKVGKSPSENHAFYLWDWRHEGPATIAYAP